MKLSKKWLSIGFTITIFIIIVIVWILNKEGVISEENFISISISGLSLIVSFVSAFFVVIQLKDTKKIQEAEFILNLNQSFVDNEQYASVYTKLENRTGTEAPPTYIEISNYLTFFETVYLLLKEEVITINVLDDLFGYRFFLAVHNEQVQNMKLVTSPKNFRNIYWLEKAWMSYREEQGLNIYKPENCLELACKKAGKADEYDEIMNQI